jgi:hypothetical protein
MEEIQVPNCLSGNLVEVEVMSFDELFDMEAWPLAIDSYQRGFVWRSDKIAQLADDLLAYQTIASPKPAYYMGTILLHRCARTKKRYIIDGQQRLTALCVLHQSITNELPPQCEMRYSSASALKVLQAQSSHQQFKQGMQEKPRIVSSPNGKTSALGVRSKITGKGQNIVRSQVDHVVY